MFLLSVTKYRWRISKNGQIVLSGIGTASEAVAVARVHGIVLTEYKDLNYLKVAA